MLTALAKADSHQSAPFAPKSRRERLLEDFTRFEKARGRDLTNEEIWAGIESDENAYNPTNDEFNAILARHETLQK